MYKWGLICASTYYNSKDFYIILLNLNGAKTRGFHMFLFFFISLNYFCSLLFYLFIIENATRSVITVSAASTIPATTIVESVPAHANTPRMAKIKTATSQNLRQLMSDLMGKRENQIISSMEAIK